MVRLYRTLGEHRRFPIAMLLALFVVLATVYNVVNPLFEAPDELWHYLYAQHLRQTWTLPVQAPTRGTLTFAQQEAGQMPVYYAIGAALTFWIPARPMEEWLRPNWHASVGSPGVADNKNRFVHGPAEAFPYQGDYLAAHLLRFVSTLFGAGTVLFTYLIALELWPGRRKLALSAAALNAFIPQYLYMSAAVHNDVPVAFFCSGALYAGLRLLRAPRVGPHHVIGLGAMAGLAILTKSSALPAVGLVVFFLAIAAWRRRSPRLLLWATPVALGTTLAITAWWFARNIATYGDWLGLSAFLGRSSIVMEIPKLSEVVDDFGGLRYSFWGLFGWFNVPVESGVYLAFDLVSILAALGLLVYAVKATRRRQGGAWLLLPIAAWLGAEFAGLLWYRTIVQAFQGRLLFGAISAAALLFVLGLAVVLPKRIAPHCGFALAFLLLVFAAIVPLRYFVPAYAMPPAHSPEAAAQLAPSPLRAELGSAVLLSSYGVDPLSAKPGDAITVTVAWQDLARLDKDYSVFVHLINHDGKLVAQRDTFPCGGLCATSLWEPGRIVVDRYVLRVPLDFPAPALGRVEVGLYDVRSGQRVPAKLSGQPAAATSVSLSTLKILPRNAPVRVPGAQPIDFEGKLRLLSSRADDRAIAGGDLVGELIWGGMTKLDKEYTVFVQLLGPAGLVAQDDAQPRAGAYPTSAWAAGEIIPHPFRLRLPASLAPGQYKLIAGVYDLATGARLHVAEGDYVDLGTVTVAPR